MFKHLHLRTKIGVIGILLAVSCLFITGQVVAKEPVNITGPTVNSIMVLDITNNAPKMTTAFTDADPKTLMVTTSSLFDYNASVEFDKIGYTSTGETTKVVTASMDVNKFVTQTGETMTVIDIGGGTGSIAQHANFIGLDETNLFTQTYLVDSDRIAV